MQHCVFLRNATLYIGMGLDEIALIYLNVCMNHFLWYRKDTKIFNIIGAQIEVYQHHLSKVVYI